MHPAGTEQVAARRPAIPALARGLKVLRQLAAAGRPGAGFGDLRRALQNLPAPTLSRLLKALAAAGYARRTPAGRYARGPELEVLGRELGSGGSLEEAARQAMAEYTRRTGESVAFARFYGDRLVLVDKIEVADSFKLAPRGQVFHPAAWEGPAVAVAAHLPATDLERLARSPDSRVDSMAEFKRLAGRCRRLGYHVEPMPNRPARGGPRRVCCAVLGPGGAPVGELHTVCPGARFTGDRKLIVSSLREAAGRLSARARSLAREGS